VIFSAWAPVLYNHRLVHTFHTKHYIPMICLNSFHLCTDGTNIFFLQVLLVSELSMPSKVPIFSYLAKYLKLSASFSIFHHRYCPLINYLAMCSFHDRMKWNKEQAVWRDWKFEAKAGTFSIFVSGVLLLILDDNM